MKFEKRNDAIMAKFDREENGQWAAIGREFIRCIPRAEAIELRDQLSALLPTDPTDWKRAYESKLLYIGMLEIDRNQLHTKCKVLANELQAKERELYSVKNGATYHLAKSFTQPDCASPIIPYDPPPKTWSVVNGFELARKLFGAPDLLASEPPASISKPSPQSHISECIKRPDPVITYYRCDPETALRGPLEEDTLASGVKPSDSALSRGLKINGGY